jgi:hypothetical protein
VQNSDGSGGGATKSSAGRGGAAAPAAVSGELGDLGAIDATEVGRLLRGEARAPAPRAVPSTGFALKSDAASGAESMRVTPASPAEVADCATQYGSQGTVRFRGSGTYGSRPAVVLGIDTDQRTIVFVVAADDCTQVLYSASR